MSEFKCPNCGKVFKYDVYDDRYPGCKEKEEIICPYCDKIVGHEMTSGIIISSAIPEEESKDKN